MNKKGSGALSILLLLTGCGLFPKPAHHLLEETPTYDPAVSARVRFLSGNGTADANYWPEKSCYRNSFLREDPDKVRVNTTNSWSYSSTSVTIGMPQSPRPYMRFDGLDFKDFIKEVVVTGDKPMTVKLASFPGPIECRPPAVTFTPTPGSDYDVFMRWQNKQCWVAVQRIDAKGADESIRPSLATECDPIGPSS